MQIDVQLIWSSSNQAEALGRNDLGAVGLDQAKLLRRFLRSSWQG